MDDPDRDEIELEGSTPSSEVDGEQADPRDKQLRDRQVEITRLQQERSELRSKLDRAEGKMEVLATVPRTTPAEQPDPFAEVDSEEFWKDYFDSHEKPQKLTKKMIEVFGSTILADRQARLAGEKRIAALEETLKTVQAGATKPDPELATKIATLREDPELADLPDKALAVLAKKMPDSQYAGGAPTSGRVAPRGNKGGRRFSDPAQKAAYQKMAEQAGW